MSLEEKLKRSHSQLPEPASVDLSKKTDGLTSEKATFDPPTIMTVPLIIYNELAQIVGLGEEERITLHRGPFRCMRLNPQHSAVQCEASIGYYRDPYKNPRAETHFFHLWSRFPIPSDVETPFYPFEYLTLASFVGDSGVWRSDLGTLREQKLHVEFHYRHLDILDLPPVKLIGFIIARAGELAKDPSRLKAEFWSKL